MEAPITEDKFNARRKAVVLKGFPLFALSFQTLGMPHLFQPPIVLHLTPCSGIVYSDIGTVSIVTFSRGFKFH